MKKNKIKKASYEELAKYLGITVSGVSQIESKKRILMLIGLYNKKNFNCQSNLSNN